VNARPQARVPARFWSWLWQGSALLGLFFALVVARCLFSARAEWEAGQRALEGGEVSLAIPCFRRSASWHVPLSPYTQRSLEMLGQLSAREDARGRGEAARLATLAQTSAEHAARNLTRPLPSDPSPLFSVIAVLGWLVWSAASLLLVTRGLDQEGQLTRLAAVAISAIVAGMGLFALGLAMA